MVAMVRDDRMSEDESRSDVTGDVIVVDRDVTGVFVDDATVDDVDSGVLHPKVTSGGVELYARPDER